MREARGRHRARVGVLLGVAAVLLTACTGDDEEATPTTSRPTPATSSDSTDPPTADGPTEPTLPAAAQGPSLSATKTFVRYYIEVFNFAMRTGDATMMRAASADKCSGCDAYIDRFEDLYQQGGYNKTRGWRPDVISLARGNGARVALFEVESDRLIYLERAGASVERFPPNRFRLRFEVRRSGRSWQVTEFQGEEV